MDLSADKRWNDKIMIGYDANLDNFTSHFW